MKDIVIDHINLFGSEYNLAASKLKKLARRNMRVLLRKIKIKRICQN